VSLPFQLPQLSEAGSDRGLCSLQLARDHPTCPYQPCSPPGAAGRRRRSRGRRRGVDRSLVRLHLPRRWIRPRVSETEDVGALAPCRYTVRKIGCLKLQNRRVRRTSKGPQRDQLDRPASIALGP
jgi:hypothetical protein